ncbi:MAG TPA: phosphoglycerate dehydrogenase [Candidatus Polarisedimenticolaceae bacterium]|nr:phosphoglycerate dehydrogenase [Candidatus Polarisedimenticolaceae bacterium]
MSSQNPNPPARVLIADNLSENGVELLRGSPDIEVTVKIGMTPDELGVTIGDYDALVVRSATKVTAEVLERPGRLRAIGRAGTGVDNIDLEAATRAGVVVMNTPGGNSVAAAELTLAHLIALARHLVQANHELRRGRWERKKYVGSEIEGKTIGIVGLGRIGREVARRAKGLRMEVVGYDPYVSTDASAGFGVRGVTLDELLAQADFVTLHLPLSDNTRHLIDASKLAKMKRGARLINCARGGLVDEDALFDALESGQLAGAALDVFEAEPPADRRLVDHPLVVATPHLGASTREAQERVGSEIAEKIRDYLRSGTILDAVNFPSFDRETSLLLRPYMDLAVRLGGFVSQIVDGGHRRLVVRTYGTIGELSLRPLVLAAVKGLLGKAVEGGVSYINALLLAKERGITVEEARSNEASAYAGLLRVRLETDTGHAEVGGTLLTADRPRLVEIDGLPIESTLDGHMLFIRNRDVPGVVGKIGTILGRDGVNIAGIHLGRTDGTNGAVSIVDVDSRPSESAITEIGSFDEITLVRAVAV